ncbi:MAG: DUF4474 domain-containing protein, partial [Clostridiales bacterium]|nr:DUF4474 domain-containing protein [Clostridiales bacterium]
TAKAPANANTQAQSTNQAATTVPATDKAADDTTTTRKTLASLFTKKATTTAPAATTTAAPAPTTAKNTKSTTKKGETTTKKGETTTAASNSGGNQTPDNFKVVEGMSDSSIVSYMYDPDGKFFYVEDNPWQRKFGFNLFYDWASPLLQLHYDTWRAKFTYDNLEWMIQGWKGQYGFIFIGSEVGVYTREPGKGYGTHYECADDNHLLYMGMSFYQNFGDGKGYVKLFERPYGAHWWTTGFVEGHVTDYKFNDRSCFCMEARITTYAPKATDTLPMQTLFANALREIGFTEVASKNQLIPGGTDAFWLSGETDVYLMWTHLDQGNSSTTERIKIG